MSTILVVAPHPDDEVIGCGGSIISHLLAGDLVSTVFLTSGELGLKHLSPQGAREIREGEARRAAEVLGSEAPIFLRLPDWEMGDDKHRAAEGLAPVISQVMPSLIYLPHPLEEHPDHAASLDVVKLAIERVAVSVQCYLYEVWSPMARWHELIDITNTIERKEAALMCYASQLADRDYVRAARGLSAYRSAMNKVGLYAEAFSVMTL